MDNRTFRRPACSDGILARTLRLSHGMDTANLRYRFHCPGALENNVVPTNLQWTRLPLFFDPAALRADLECIEAGEWIAHFNQQDYEGEWSSVALRARGGRANDIVPMGGVEEYEDTPLARRCPHLKAAMDAFKLPKKSVRLLRLHAGSKVREHRDPDLGLGGGELRIHVPVASSDEVEFVVAGRRLVLREGEAWYIDSSQPHRIDNRGTSDRIHLVIDGLANEWALNLLERGLSEMVTETFEPAGVESFRQFGEMVFEDAELQGQLLAVADRGQFVEAVLAAAARRGYALEAAVVESEWNRRHREWLEQGMCA